jgi:hypothetical protein
MEAASKGLNNLGGSLLVSKENAAYFAIHPYSF